MAKIYLWDRLFSAWVLNFEIETCTYNIHDAQLFSESFDDFDKERYYPHEESHANKSVDFTLELVHDTFHIGHRTKYKFPVYKRKTSIHGVDYGLKAFDKDDHTLVSTEEKWGYRFDSSHEWYLFDSRDEALEHAKDRAIKEMSASGWHHISLFDAYVTKVAELDDYSDDYVVPHKNANPLHSLPKSVLNVGDTFDFDTQGNYRYARHCLLRDQIRDKRKYCKTPRLNDHLKGMIRNAMAVFDNAYAIEVAGIFPFGNINDMNNRETLGGVPGAMSGIDYRHFLLFRAVIDGQERVLIPRIYF